jgi:hypothetical protein
MKWENNINIERIVQTTCPERVEDESSIINKKDVKLHNCKEERVLYIIAKIKTQAAARISVNG